GKAKDTLAVAARDWLVPQVAAEGLEQSSHSSPKLQRSRRDTTSCRRWGFWKRGAFHLAGVGTEITRSCHETRKSGNGTDREWRDPGRREWPPRTGLATVARAQSGCEGDRIQGPSDLAQGTEEGMEDHSRRWRGHAGTGW